MYSLCSVFKDDWLVNFPNTYQDVFDTPCTQIKNETFMNYVQQNWNTSITFESSGMPGKCDEFMKDFVMNCRDFELCFDFSESQNEPENEIIFYAVSSYYWEFWRFLNTNSNVSTVSMQTAKTEIERICNSATTANITDCFEVTYIYHILSSAYKIQVCSYILTQNVS